MIIMKKKNLLPAANFRRATTAQFNRRPPPAAKLRNKEVDLPSCFDFSFSATDTVFFLTILRHHSISP
ncbi:hypothetical protein KFK09_011759 [Dendrobium nobile]|uniref:Uncharacterized protein n=1 Tax=Dendrobium nobile TaxID=94219 RepID=A0A8T3BGY1_DENNO|nr:hypothetical protein KFK09_011759 [Dendrobium nobile]